MKWFNLRRNMCPKCNKSFVNGLTHDKATLMLHHNCGFSITEQKYQQIVSGMVNFDLEERDRENEEIKNG